ncbi:hypothetical protein AAVH_18747 [Aphelenchoides avenae]|nr:hypothetical protein AAVH_18747 [Aphelenchus avenae]
MISLDEAKEVVTVVEFICYLIHFSFGYYFVKRVMSLSLMHPNLRILMSNIVIEFTLIGIGRIGDFAVAMLLPYDATRTVICVPFKIINDTGVQMGTLNFIWIALERLTATVQIRTYEAKTDRVRKVLMKTAYGLTLAAALAVTVFDAYVTEGFDPRYSETCQTSIVHPWIIPVAVVNMSFIFVFISVLLWYLYRHNKDRKQSKRSAPLAARYQYAENVATLAVIVPSVVIYGICIVACWPLLPIFWKAWKSDDIKTQIFLNQITFVIAAVCSIICPLGFMLKYPPLNDRLLSDLRRLRLLHKQNSGRNRVVDAIQAASETNRHFKQLQEFWWNKPFSLD